MNLPINPHQHSKVAVTPLPILQVLLQVVSTFHAQQFGVYQWMMGLATRQMVHHSVTSQVLSGSTLICLS